jgi:DNA-binding protein YbaB
MTISGSARRDGVSVEVLPGGALTSLELAPEALRAGGHALAGTILTLVREASAQAGERAKHAMADELGGLDRSGLTKLGLAQDGSLAETAESTVPDSWRV